MSKLKKVIADLKEGTIYLSDTLYAIRDILDENEIPEYAKKEVAYLKELNELEKFLSPIIDKLDCFLDNKLTEIKEIIKKQEENWDNS